MRFFIPLLITLFIFQSCGEGVTPSTTNPDGSELREKEVAVNLGKLKSAAKEGDLIVRLNDDFVSEQLRFFNEEDKSFSHSGIIITKNGVKTVCNILPGNPGTNPVVYTPIDSFLNPETNTSCGLFRYTLPAAEMTAFVNEINAHVNRKIYFDSVINMATDDSLYCSEMIYKSMRVATRGRINFRLHTVPEKMQPTLFLFYRGRLSKEDIAKRQVIFIDNLYRIQECTELMRFRLKYFPGT
jgi:hypothetical protein